MADALTDTNLDNLISAYYDAMIAIAAGQSYSIGGRSLTRANLTEVKKTYYELLELKNKRSSGPNRNRVRFRKPLGTDTS